jgi:formate dehydrogenase alpha subunit
MSGQAVAENMVSIVIDGKAVQVEKGTTILTAARGNGSYIPTLCYLEKLKPIGSCRLCSVEVEGIASMVMSCKTPVAEGMKITTDNERIKKYRQDMMRMILVNHPLDCPVCERSGECWLQNRTFELEVTGHTWSTEGFTKQPVVDWGLIQYDQNLCIMCERCIKVCREVQGFAAYRIDGTGYDSKINTVTGEKLDCDFCGQCISVCPVGALSSGIYFSGRSWEMKRTATICPHCAVGCTYLANTKKGKIVRVTSNDFIGINNGNLCSRGRFGYEFIQNESRLEAPLVKTGHGFKAVTWETAVASAAEKLAGYRDKYGKDAFVGIGSERGTNEDNYVFQKFFRDVLGTGNIDNIANMINPDVCSKRFETFDDFQLNSSYGEFSDMELAVFIGADGSNETPVVSNLIRKAGMEHNVEVAVAYSREGVFLPEPRLQLPYGYLQMYGFTVNLLSSAIADVKNNGVFPGGLKPDSAWAATVKKAAKKAKPDDVLAGNIETLVQLIRERGKTVFLIGQEAQKHPQSTAIIQNTVNLAKLIGGKVMLLREYGNTQGVNDMGVAPNVLPGYGKEERGNLKADADIIELMESGKVKALVILEEDVLRRYYDAERFRKAMEKVEFKLLVTQFYNKTSPLVDMILPATTLAETDGTVTNLEGRCQKVARVVENVGRSLAGWQIFADMASAMGSGFGYKQSGDVTAEIGREVPLYEGTGKESFLVDYSPLVKSPPALKWTEPSEIRSVESDFIVLQDYPLFGLGTYTDFCPSLRPLLGKPKADLHLQGKPFVEINPEDAGTIGATDGSLINLKFAEGEWTGQLRLKSRVRKGTIRVPEEMDNSRIESITVNGSSVSCVNLAVLRG